MTSTTFFIIFIPILSIVLLLVNLLFAPHNPYQEKDSVFECGFHSFLGQNRTQFSVSFFIFGLLFLLFDLEILLVYPYSVSGYTNDIYGLVIMMLFFTLLTLGFVFELGKNALSIESKQTTIHTNKPTPSIDTFITIQPSSMVAIFSIIALSTRQFIFSILRRKIVKNVIKYLTYLGAGLSIRYPAIYEFYCFMFCLACNSYILLLNIFNTTIILIEYKYTYFYKIGLALYLEYIRLINANITVNQLMVFLLLGLYSDNVVVFFQWFIIMWSSKYMMAYIHSCTHFCNKYPVISNIIISYIQMLYLLALFTILDIYYVSYIVPLLKNIKSIVLTMYDPVKEAININKTSDYNDPTPGKNPQNPEDSPITSADSKSNKKRKPSKPWSDLSEKEREARDKKNSTQNERRRANFEEHNAQNRQYRESVSPKGQAEKEEKTRKALELY